MSVGILKLDESTRLNFDVSITGADGLPSSRFVIDGPDFSVSFPTRQTNEGLEVDVKGLQNIFKAGDYQARLEVVLENRIYTPLEDTITFIPSVYVQTKAKTVVKESVKVSVKKTVINENELRKTQAATIIANSLNYHPEANETPKEIVNHAIASCGTMTEDQAKTVAEMLALAESCGIEYDKNLTLTIQEQ